VQTVKIVFFFSVVSEVFFHFVGTFLPFSDYWVTFTDACWCQIVLQSNTSSRFEILDTIFNYTTIIASTCFPFSATSSF